MVRQSHLWCSRYALAFAASVLALLTLPAVVQAAEVQKIEALAPPNDPVVLPSAEGAWRSRTQFVFDPSASRLIRRTYTLFDTLASEGLDFVWMPDSAAGAAGGRITGHGRVAWREPGAPSYDRSAEVAAYVGDMVDGRAEGQGTYVHRSGVSYKGQWRNGLMDGEGRLSLPNGDQYVGGFAGGRLHGAGVYVDATGTIYEGAFVAGLRDGAGLVRRPDGGVYRASWKAGRELPGTRRLIAAAVTNVQYEEIPGLRIGVLVDPRPSFVDEPITPLPYAGDSEGETLRIAPADQRLLNVWRGRDEIQLTGGELSDYYNYERGFLGSRYRYEPVAVVFELENSGDEPVRIVGGFLDVARSASDLDPAIHLVVEQSENACTAGDISSPRFRLENYGWARADDAKVTLNLVGDDGRAFEEPVSKDIGSIDRSAVVDLAPDLERFGVDIASLGRKKIACPQGSWEEGALQCLAAARTQGTFGRLAPFVSVDDINVGLSVKGHLDYNWSDANGNRHAKTSPFDQWIVLGTFEYGAECGEGGQPSEVAQRVFSFDLDRENYRIAVPLTDDVPAGVTGRWRITLDAPKSSEHDFRIVLQLADGRRVASRPIDFLYFKPRS